MEDFTDDVRFCGDDLEFIAIVDDISVGSRTNPFAVQLTSADDILDLLGCVSDGHFVDEELELYLQPVVIVGKIYPVTDGDNAHTGIAQVLQFHKAAAVAAGETGKVLDHKDIVLVASSQHVNAVGELRALVHELMIEGVAAPVLVRRVYDEATVESLRIKASADLGVLLIDGLVDGLWLENPSSSAAELNSIMFGILQATRARISKTEYIACPGCGRTMYDLQGTWARIKAATSHL